MTSESVINPAALDTAIDATFLCAGPLTLICEFTTAGLPVDKSKQFVAEFACDARQVFLFK
jgi:hypothetical protein